jgi:hypothetical protein
MRRRSKLYYHNTPPPKSAPQEFKTQKPLLITVNTDFYSGQAVWEYTLGAWRCARCDKPLRWMIGKSANQIAITLLRLDAVYSWSRLEPADNVEEIPKATACQGTGASEPRSSNLKGQPTYSTTRALGTEPSNMPHGHRDREDKSLHPVRRHPLKQSTATVP